MEREAPVRQARPTDSARLRYIEIAAGARFRDIGMPEIADDEPMSVERLNAYAEEGRSWVAVDTRDVPVGYAVVDVVDGSAHLEQMSVDPDHQGKGLSGALLTEVERWARDKRMRAITLTTFEHVPWNAPLYAHLGFRPLADHELTDGLRSIVEREATHGLDVGKRVCMRLELS